MSNKKEIRCKVRIIFLTAIFVYYQHNMEFTEELTGFAKRAENILNYIKNIDGCQSIRSFFMNEEIFRHKIKICYIVSIFVFRQESIMEAAESFSLNIKAFSLNMIREVENRYDWMKPPEVQGFKSIFKKFIYD